METPSKIQKSLLRTFLGITLLGLTFCAQEFGVWTKLENDINEIRMRHSNSPASGEIVFIAIDKKTLNHVGTWPWPRSVFADAVNKTMEHAVNDLFIDVDFSAPSSPDQDKLLETALEQAGGAVTLPVFSQSHSVDHTEGNLVDSRPLPQFEAQSWLASVNVVPDSDGIVRHFPYAQELDGSALLSVPSILSGTTGQIGTQFGINFGIDANSIPTFSMADLLDGTIPSGTLDNKSVVIGAHAIELRDTFAVPVHGMLSGAEMQILAAETLLQQKQVVELKGIWPISISAFFIIGILAFWYKGKLKYRILTLISYALALEAIGYFLMKSQSTVLPTVGSHVLIVCAAILLAILEINIRGWLAKLAKAQSKSANELLAQIFEDSSDAMVVLDENGNILKNSRTALSLFATTAQNGDGLLLASDLPQEILDEAALCMSELKGGDHAHCRSGAIEIFLGSTSKITEYVITPSRIYLPENGIERKIQETVIASITAQDVTEKRLQTERLEYLSSHDALTGTMQRHAFTKSIDAQLHKARTSGSVAILAFSLRRFNSINATLGSDVGDALLKAVVDRLEQSDMEIIDIGRIGGRTFAVAVKSDVSSSSLVEKSATLLKLLEQTFALPEASVQVGAYVGYAKQDAHSIRAPELLSNAELALSDAKASIVSSIAAFDPVSSAKQIRAREIERELLPSLQRGEFFVTYQPQIDVETEQMIGVEALLRWKHPSLGFISPDEFIQIAETNGFIDELGRWVLNQACRDVAEWPTDISVAVNVSPMQFMHTDIVADVKQALKTSGLKPSRLHLEITESSFLGSTKELVETLYELRSFGISLALDDFGTGYASFGYISKFPLNKIKIDQMFVRTLNTDPASRSIIQFTKNLSDILGLKLLCEGVETEQQMAFLKEIGCHEVQGYLYGKPKKSEDIVEFLQQNERLQKAS